MGLFLTTSLDRQLIHPDSNPLFFHCFLGPGNITTFSVLILSAEIPNYLLNQLSDCFVNWVGVFSFLPGPWRYPAFVIHKCGGRDPLASNYLPVFSLYLQEFSLLQVLEPFVAVRRFHISLAFLLSPNGPHFTLHIHPSDSGDFSALFASTQPDLFLQMSSLAFLGWAQHLSLHFHPVWLPCLIW